MQGNLQAVPGKNPSEKGHLFYLYPRLYHCPYYATGLI